MDQETKEGVVTADEARIQHIRVMAAAVKFVNLMKEGKIPPKSKLVCAEVGIEKDGNISDRTITLLAIPPDEKAIRPLEPDRLATQREKVEKEGYSFRILGTQEIEMDGDRLVLRDFRLDLSPTEDGRLAELRVGKKGGSPPETVATVTTKGMTINDWQGFREWLDSETFGFQIPLVGEEIPLPVKDVIDSEPFKIYITKLAKGEFPKGTKFLFHYIYAPDNSEVKPIMAGAAEFPNGTIEELQENLKPLLDNLRERGVRILFNPTAFTVEFPDLAECPECGKRFVPKRSDQVYCNEVCGGRFRARRAYEKKKAAAGE